ncbi:MAG: hypothetical protein IJU75_03555 [Clostridia bacterium]|nr:hypothetical protein [Clostridia bacterium]
MKKLISMILALVMVAAFVPVTSVGALTATSGWEKSADGKWHISDAKDLLAFAEKIHDGCTFAGEEVVLDGDVVFNDKTADEMKADGTGLNEWPVNASDAGFAGTFNGNGHGIYGLYAASTGNLGFVYTVNGGRFENVSFRETYFKGGHYVGVVAVVTSYYAEFENVSVDGIIEAASSGYGNYFGGFVATLRSAAAFTSCIFNGSVNGKDDVGGFIGIIETGGSDLSFDSCTNNGRVSGRNLVGGFVGFTYNTGIELSFEECLNSGAVSGASYVGGFVGDLYGSGTSASFVGCVNDGALTGSGGYIGGFVGTIEASASEGLTFDSCTNIGDVNAAGTNIGGFIGGLFSAFDISFGSCLNAGAVRSSKTTGNVNAGGFVGGKLGGSLEVRSCMNQGDVSANQVVGGFVGEVKGNCTTVFIDSLNAGALTTVNSGYIMGGFVGQYDGTETVTVTRCVNVGNIHSNQPNNDGGFTCYVGGGTVTFDNFFNLDGSVVGSDGIVLGSAAVTGTVTSVLLADLASLGSTLGSGWGYKFIPVPACFTDGTYACDGRLHVKTVEDLMTFANFDSDYSGVTVVLDNDIVFNDMTAEEMKTSAPANVYSNPGTFKGTFDGQNHSITGLYFNGVGGLFESIDGTDGGKIKDLNLVEACNVSGIAYPALLARGITNGTIEGVYISGFVGGDWYLGGFCAYIDEPYSGNATVFKNCWFDGVVESGRERAAAFVGGTYAAQTLTFEDCLNTGTVTCTGNALVSGFVGYISADLGSSSVNFTRCVNLGLVRTASARCGAFVGNSVSGATVVFENSLKLNGASGSTDVYGSAAVTGAPATVDCSASVSGSAAFSSWGWNKTGDVVTYAPCNKNYSAQYTVVSMKALVDSVAGVSAGSGEDKGLTEYTVFKTGTNVPFANSCVNAFRAEGFILVYENNASGKGVYIAQLTKSNALVTVNYANNSGTTFVSAMLDQPLSPHLNDSFSGTAISGNKNSLAQLKLTESGDSYVIQLKNTHFIVVDGGESGDLEGLIAYLEDHVSAGQTPVIEAWFFTHLHADHSGLLMDFSSDPSFIDRVFLEGFYFNEPSSTVKNYSGGVYTQINQERLAIASLRTSAGATPVIYRPMTGQRYYFCDVTVDVMASQDLFTDADIAYWYDNTSDPDYTANSGNGGFNDSSTWYKFTLDAKTFIEGGDSYKAGMDFIMASYDREDIRCDYFSVLHHGASTWNDFTDWVGGFDNLLFPTSHEREYENVLVDTRNVYLRNHASGESYYAYLGTETFVFDPVSTFNYGDLDASGEIDTVDLSLLRQYLAGSSGLTIDLNAADTDGSGEIDTVDLSLLRQYLAGGVSALGPSA